MTLPMIFFVGGFSAIVLVMPTLLVVMAFRQRPRRPASRFPHPQRPSYEKAESPHVRRSF